MGARIRPEELTPRMLEVIALVGSGMTNRQAAAQLWITEDTAKTHLKRLYDRIGAKSAAHAVTLLHAADILPLGGRVPERVTVLRLPEQRAGDANTP